MLCSKGIIRVKTIDISNGNLGQNAYRLTCRDRQVLMYRLVVDPASDEWFKRMDSTPWCNGNTKSMAEKHKMVTVARYEENIDDAKEATRRVDRKANDGANKRANSNESKSEKENV